MIFCIFCHVISDRFAMQCGKIVLQEAQRVLQKVTYSCCRHAQQGIRDGRVSVRPSVRLSRQLSAAAACGWFAAERWRAGTGSRYRSTAAGAAYQL